MSVCRVSEALHTGDAPWPCWIEVDLDAIAHNVETIRALVGPSCQVMAVVKAGAYGHGDVAVARAALEAGATWLAVARVREGARLLDAGVRAPILVLGSTPGNEIPVAVELGLRPTLVTVEQARAFSEVASTKHTETPVHVKLDTGISRYGVPLEDARLVAREVCTLPGLRLEGVFSHFATADEPDLAFAARQLESFTEAVSAMREDGLEWPITHMAASAAIVVLQGSHFDMVRLGISLYGLYPSQYLRDRIDLCPALSFHSRVARVFDLRSGQSVGYGRTFVAEGPVKAALVPVGYADGLPRSHSNRGAVLVNGLRAPIIGRISMDQSVVDVSGCGIVKEDDPVVIIGTQGSGTIGCDEFASCSGTISYEVLTTLGCRVPRVYRQSGKVVGVGFLDEGRYEIV
jgi:alanine racemase